MTSLPPAGWYPDPEAGGTQWRWWDGDRWAAPASAANPYFARALALHRSDTSRYGNWLRWAMLGSAADGLVVFVGFALLMHSNGFNFMSGANGAPQVAAGRRCGAARSGRSACSSRSSTSGGPTKRCATRTRPVPTTIS